MLRRAAFCTVVRTCSGSFVLRTLLLPALYAPRAWFRAGYLDACYRAFCRLPATSFAALPPVRLLCCLVQHYLYRTPVLVLVADGLWFCLLPSRTRRTRWVCVPVAPRAAPTCRLCRIAARHSYGSYRTAPLACNATCRLPPPFISFASCLVLVPALPAPDILQFAHLFVWFTSSCLPGLVRLPASSAALHSSWFAWFGSSRFVSACHLTHATCTTRFHGTWDTSHSSWLGLSHLFWTN